MSEMTGAMSLVFGVEGIKPNALSANDRPSTRERDDKFFEGKARSSEETEIAEIDQEERTYVLLS